MRTVHKYPLSGRPGDPHFVASASPVITTHGRPRWLWVADQWGTLTAWAEVEDSDPLTKVELSIVGTGTLIPDQAGEYIGSAMVGPYVFHVYEDRRDG